MRNTRVPLLSWLLIAGAVLPVAALGVAGALTMPVFAEQTVSGQQVPVEDGGSYTDVHPAGLASMLEAKDFPLVNVHIPYEGEIEGTDLFIPFNEIEAHLGELPSDPSAKLVLYCRTGGMSAIAARALVKLGYTNVWNLDGGMVGWTEAGYPLVTLGR